MNPVLTYVHDPMCSWCYAFRPTWRAIVAELPPGLATRRLLGGLAPDSDAPMPAALREKLEATWHRIEQVVPGTRFDFAFWRDGAPRRSTYPACRAVIAAVGQNPAAEEAMISLASVPRPVCHSESAALIVNQPPPRLASNSTVPSAVFQPKPS